MAIKVGFVSLGCPKNLLNTEVMLAKLVDHGMELVAEDIEADVIVINTCAFIESAKNEAIENILDIAWLKKNRSLKGIVVTGPGRSMISAKRSRSLTRAEHSAASAILTKSHSAANVSLPLPNILPMCRSRKAVIISAPTVSFLPSAAVSGAET